MKRALILVALCTSLGLPAAVSAQAGPPGSPGMMPGADRPSPALRAAMEKAHAEAKAAAFAALTPAHAASVQSLIGAVAVGSLDRRAAAAQIDALLTADEKSAITAAAEKAFRTMHAAMGGAGAPPPPPPPDAGPPPERGRFGKPTAGRLLLMFALPPPAMRMTQPMSRSSAAP